MELPAMLPGRDEARRDPMSFLSGPLPLQRSLRRLLGALVRCGERLVAPSETGWPEVLLRPYTAYLQDLGLVIFIGPFLEVTPLGRRAAALSDPADPAWPAWSPPPGRPAAETAAACPRCRYHLVRRICMTLLELRGQHDWGQLQAWLDGPLGAVRPAFAEWFRRFRDTAARHRRIWNAGLVRRFEDACPGSLGHTCLTTLQAEPEELLEQVLADSALLLTPAILREGLPSREAWLVAVALHWAARRGAGLDYARAGARFRADGLQLPPRAAMVALLEEAGLLVTDLPELKLLLPAEPLPPEGALYPYGDPAWVVAALLEGGAFTLNRRRNHLH